MFSLIRQMHVEFVNYASIYLSIHPSNKIHYQHRCTCPSIIHHPCIKTCLSIYLSNLLSDIIWVRRPYVWWTFVIMYAVCRLQLLVVTSTNARLYTTFEPFYRTLLCHKSNLILLYSTGALSTNSNYIHANVRGEIIYPWKAQPLKFGNG